MYCELSVSSEVGNLSTDTLVPLSLTLLPYGSVNSEGFPRMDNMNT